MTEMMTDIEIPTDADLPLRVSELLASRLCHDLISPVAAISNGFELLGDEAVGSDPEIGSLISLSIHNAAGRLTMFRAAYGLGGENADAMMLADAATLIEGVVETDKIAVDLSREPVPPGRAAIKLYLNMAMLALEALPARGTLRLSVDESDGFSISAIAEGTGVALRPEIMEAVSETASVEALTPRSVQGYFTAWLARSAGLDFTVSDTGSGTVTLSATPR